LPFQYQPVDLLLPIPINPPLRPKHRITARLKNPTHLKRQRHLPRLRNQIVTYLHRVSQQPIRQHRHPEPLAGPCARVGEDLRQREGGFDGEAEVADYLCVEGRGVQWGEEGVEDEEKEGQCGEVFPVSMPMVSGCSLSSQIQASKYKAIDLQPL